MARLNYKEVLKGDKGTTFTPYVTQEGLLYWKNDGGLINPTPVNIQGKQGEQGAQGEIGRLTEEQEKKIDRVINDYNDAISNLTNGNENATNSEIVQARNGEVNLNRRLDKFDAQLDNIAEKISVLYKTMPVLDITDFGADNTGNEDISQVLNYILSNYNSAEIKFPKGIYFIDLNNNSEIGNDYNKNFIFRGCYKDSVIKINSYIGGDTSLNLKGRIDFRSLVFDGMTKDQNVVINKNLNCYLSGVRNIEDCIIRNFNGNIVVNARGKVRIVNNIFDYFVDHAIYIRETFDALNDSQELIIEGNEFLGTGRIQDFYEPSSANPRHAIKLAGRLNFIRISNNKFKGNFGDILVEQQSEGMQMVKELYITNNVFYGSYSSILLNGTSSTIPTEFDSMIFIEGNKFFDGSLIGIENYDLPSNSPIYIKKGFSSKELVIRNNYFNGSRLEGSPCVAITCEDNCIYDSRKVDIDFNTFYNTSIYIKKLDCVFNNNLIKNCERFLYGDDSIRNILNNTFIRCNVVTYKPSTYISNTLFENNKFVDCPCILKSGIYGAGHMWMNNTIINSTVFDNTESSSPKAISSNFIFANNTLLNSCVLDGEWIELLSEVNKHNNNQMIDNVWKANIIK